MHASDADEDGGSGGYHWQNVLRDVISQINNFTNTTLTSLKEDPEKSEKIIELFKDINSKGTTVLIATHDYSIIKKYKARTLKCADEKISEIEITNE